MKIISRPLKLNRILAVATVLLLVLIIFLYVEQYHFLHTSWKSPTQSSNPQLIEEMKKPSKDSLVENMAEEAFLDKLEIVSQAYGLLQNLEKKVEADEEKLTKIKEMAKHAWDNYVKYAWGHNELRPLSKTFHDSTVIARIPLGATIVDSIDTLYLMGLEKEYAQAAEWIRNKLNFADAPTEVSVFEITIRFVGGLLGIYSLTKEKVFLDRAVSIIDNLLPAFDATTGLPTSLFNLRTKKGRNFNWASGGCHILSEIGTLHMEFQFASELTGDPKYGQIVHKIRDHVVAAAKMSNYEFHTHINAHRQGFCNRRITLSGEGDSFFEYLLKEWIRTGHADTEARELYDRSLESFERLQMLRTSKAGSFYVADSRDGSPGYSMSHLACFAGGMFALGAKEKNTKDVWFLRGKQLTETCRKSYVQTETCLGPDSFYFTNNIDAVAISANDKRYLLRPETVESYFYMWRLTHDPVYRDYAWDVVQALEKHCRTPNGFSGLKDVTNVNTTQDDVQQTFFLAETLKYLYLIFCNDSVLSLDQWVFNSEGHPFPITPRRPG